MSRRRQISLARYLVLLAVLAALGLGRLELHAPDHGLTGWSPLRAVEPCDDGLEVTHLEALRMIYRPPCAACLLACSGQGTVKELIPASSRLLPAAWVEGEELLAPSVPAPRCFAPRGPPALLWNA
ncbi:MAG: hypothetical protein KDD47_17860 [Acidobacteria bacterium]|nr:hypothetical protein [Acidobacteriota bacterium]